MFHHYKVPELQRFLRDRGISTGNSRKDHLIRLAEAAADMNVPSVAPDDYHSMSVSRRTVGDPVTGNDIVLSDVDKVTGWTPNLTMLPTIEIGDVMVYLLGTCGWTNDRLKTYKTDNSFQLFQANHVYDVNCCVLGDSNFIYIRSKCVPETRQSEKPYDTWVLLDKSGTVKSGGCTCVADDGSCKHCVALLFSLESFSSRHSDRNTEVGTDRQCLWDKPRVESKPSQIDNLTYGKAKLNMRHEYQPINIRPNNSQREMETALYNLCKGTGALVLQTIDPPSDDSESESNDELKTMLDFIAAYDGNSDLSNYLCDCHPQSYIDEVEKQTRGQADNDIWFQQRKGRITASISSSVLRCKMEKLNPTNYIYKQVMGTSVSFKTNATEYGKNMEKVALRLYIDSIKPQHKKFVYSECGLFISKDAPYIAASPDGKIHCDCCGIGLVEVKCSFTHQNKTPLEVSNESNYFLYNDNGTVRLKKDKSWYIQIQTQLGVSNLKFCDFVFYTQKGLSIERILFDEEMYRNITSKCYEFFVKFIK